MASMSKVREIISGVDIDEIGAEYGFIGIRVQDEAFGLHVGDTVMHNSHIWDDGEDTEEELDGVCAMNLRALDMIICEYYGETILVLGSDDAEYGDDLGEIVMRDAKVLAVINL